MVINKAQNFLILNNLKNILEVGAGTLDKTLSKYAAENSITNFEFLSCIPGSLGGTVKMNSGYYGNNTIF